jgi:hypothetical protein
MILLTKSVKSSTHFFNERRIWRWTFRMFCTFRCVHCNQMNEVNETIHQSSIFILNIEFRRIIISYQFFGRMTYDIWHMTYDIWHTICDIQIGQPNIDSILYDQYYRLNMIQSADRFAIGGIEMTKE